MPGTRLLGSAVAYVAAVGGRLAESIPAPSSGSLAGLGRKFPASVKLPRGQQLRRTAPSDCRIAQRSAQGRLESLTRQFYPVYTRGYGGGGEGVRRGGRKLAGGGVIGAGR